jgi:prepilin-type processing-associated H-X9-DG protein
MKILPTQVHLFCGFARADAVMVLFSLLLLALVAWVAIWVGGEKRRVWVCTHHMKTLGQAFAEYAQEHGGALPPAAIDDGTNSTSWDKEISVYLEPALARQNSPEKEKELETKIAHLFKCPSDRMPRRGGPPRSYSMPMYDINRVGWPPEKDSSGGLGLYLDAKMLHKARQAMPSESPDYIPAIKGSMAPMPADTALLVECFNIQNVLWSPKLACISSSKEQFSGKIFKANNFHGGKMNYLMLDGHVELLSSQTLALLPSGNADYPKIWTIKGGN